MLYLIFLFNSILLRSYMLYLIFLFNNK